MDRTKSVVTAERFAKGMTFDEYVKFTGSPDNLKREGSMAPRRDFSGFLRQAYENARLSDEQVGAIRWLVAQPNGPAKILVISEEWSSDCRRDVPMLARLAEAGGMELRIFPRDGQKMARDPKANPAEQPNADLMNEFLNEKNGQTWQSIPVAAFYTKDMRYLYHYTEFPKIYEKDRVVGAIRAAKAGETKEQTAERGQKDFFALQASPFFQMWACAGVDEILTKLHERLVVGSIA
jgi:hypothetical protein